MWRSPDSLQIGVDRAIVVLESVTNAEERMLAALVGGTTDAALALLAETAGATPDETAALLRRVAPALVPAAETDAPLRPRDIVVTGVGPTADRIRYVLEERGMLLRDAGEHDRPDLAIVVAHFVVDPADRARWLSLDVPHLPVLLGDRSARLGPLIEPGQSACLQCLELHRRDDDAAWPAMAAQLWGRAAAVDTPLFAGELVCQVMRLVERRLDTGAPRNVNSVTVDAASGLRTTTAWQMHPECGCATPPGSDSTGGRRPAAAPATTTGAGAPVLA